MKHKTFILLLLPTSSQRASSHQELLGFVRGSRYIAFVFASSGCSISGSHVSGFVAPLQPDVHRRVDSKKNDKQIISKCLTFSINPTQSRFFPLTLMYKNIVFCYRVDFGKGGRGKIKMLNPVLYYPPYFLKTGFLSTRLYIANKLYFKKV